MKREVELSMELNSEPKERERFLSSYGVNTLLQPIVFAKKGLVYSPVLDRFFSIKVVLTMACYVHYYEKAFSMGLGRIGTNFELYGFKCWAEFWHDYEIQSSPSEEVIVGESDPDPAEILAEYLTY